MLRIAREFSKAFYQSKEWKRVREYIFNRDNGICQDCYKKGIVSIGKEVHHIIFLTADNINNQSVTLGEDNLILLCKECHHSRHNKTKSTRDNLMFDSVGNLIEVSSPP